MKKIAIVTATRAEYGLLTPLIRRIINDKELKLELIVTGAHLSDKQEYTINAIYEDGFPISHIIPILEGGNSAYDISATMANAIRGFARCFRDDRPDMVVILGDRTEMLGIASAAMNERIPIAHIHGGEITEGAVDDCIRHALTKMSYIHFTATEEYRNRVIQLGESPNRVFNVGSLGTENILNEKLMNENEIRDDIGISLDKKYSVVTFHPVTLEDETAEDQARTICDVIANRIDIIFVITKANADKGGEIVNRIFEKFSEKYRNAILVHSLGMRKYLSAVKFAEFVMGNSSSGILEAPVLGTPTVNIGDRQKGRIMVDTIINCPCDRNKILDSLDQVRKIHRNKTRIYGNGETSKRIVTEIKNIFDNGIFLKKGFYDIGRLGGK